jgi:hypothetical protein
MLGLPLGDAMAEQKFTPSAQLLRHSRFSREKPLIFPGA